MRSGTGVNETLSSIGGMVLVPRATLIAHAPRRGFNQLALLLLADGLALQLPALARAAWAVIDVNPIFGLLGMVQLLARSMMVPLLAVAGGAVVLRLGDSRARWRPLDAAALCAVPAVALQLLFDLLGAWLPALLDPTARWVVLGASALWYGALLGVSLVQLRADRSRGAADSASAPGSGGTRSSSLAGYGIAALVVALLVLNGSGVMLHCGLLRGARNGSLAPSYALRDETGRRVASEHLVGKVVLLDFWALWCGPCVAKFPLLEGLADEFSKDGLVVLAVNVERRRASLLEIQRRRGEKRSQRGVGPSGVRFLLDDGQVSFRYGVQTLPHLVLVGRGGQIVYQHRGGGGADALRQQVIGALARRP